MMAVYTVDWTARARERVWEFGDYVARQSSLEEAGSLVERIFEAGDALAWSPQRYAPAPEWGEGVRRLPVLGRRILFEVDEVRREVRILSVVGGAENPRDIH